MLVAPLSQKNFITENIVALCLFTPQMEIVTTDKGSLVRPDKLKILLLNVAALLMAALLLSL